MIVAQIPFISDAVGWVVDKAGDLAAGAWEAIVNSLVEAADELLKAIVAAWTRYPGDAGDNATLQHAQQLMDDTVVAQMTAGVAVICLIYSAAHATWAAALGKGGEEAQAAGLALFRTMLVGSAGIAILTAATSLSNSAAQALLEQGPEVPTLGDAGLSVGIMFFLGIFAIVGAIIQVFFLTLRGPMLVLLGGAWQLTAASSGTRTGAQAFQKVNGWLIAFVLYKPAAALVYRAAFMLLDDAGEGDIVAAIQGVLLMVLAVFTLPAMLRLVAPAVTAMGSSASVAGAAAAGAALATGAIAMGGAPGLGGGLGNSSGGSMSPGGASGGLASGGSAGGSEPGPVGGGVSGAGAGASSTGSDPAGARSRDAGDDTGSSSRAGSAPAGAGSQVGGAGDDLGGAGPLPATGAGGGSTDASDVVAGAAGGAVASGAADAAKNMTGEADGSE